MAPLLLTISLTMLGMVTTVRSIPEDTCQPRGCPDLNGPPLFGDAILDAANCGPNGIIRCGIAQYPSMKLCTCPNDLVCVEELTQQLWTEKSKYIGNCVGRACSDTPYTPKSQRECHSPQRCVYKTAGLESRLDGRPSSAAKGRCLWRTCSDGKNPGPCPPGWTCIKESYDP